ncbi:uncharacterized protein ACBR49_018449 [Aulostomus maculatus]
MKMIATAQQMARMLNSLYERLAAEQKLGDVESTVLTIAHVQYGLKILNNHTQELLPVFDSLGKPRPSVALLTPQELNVSDMQSGLGLLEKYSKEMWQLYTSLSLTDQQYAELNLKWMPVDAVLEGLMRMKKHFENLQLQFYSMEL